VLAQLVDELRYVSECSIPDGVTGIFIDIILRPHYGLRSTQPVTEMSTRNISWAVKSAGA